MLWWQNIPLVCLILCLLSGAVCSVLKAKASRCFLLSLLFTVCVSNLYLLLQMIQPEVSAYRFMMGHFPAPWGNEIRIGRLEPLLGAFFSGMMFLIVLGGSDNWDDHLGADRSNLYCSVCGLLMAALQAQIYSNDLFTSYVFLEIMTLAACALIVSKRNRLTLASAMRYMVLNLVGSGLFLFGVVMLYHLTGHLLMENIRDTLSALISSDSYNRPILLVIALITTGLCIKCALFPFHTWVPDAYSFGTPTSNAIMSSLVSKGYIVLLLKIFCRVFGWDLVQSCGIDRILMIFSLIGMLWGSFRAIQTDNPNRMIAWSSVSQIGYILLGVSLGAYGGYQAAVYHTMVHTAAKSLLFLSGSLLQKASGNDSDLALLRGAGRKAPLAGFVWTVAAFTIIGLPFTGGLVTKVLLAQNALSHSSIVFIAVCTALVISTLLNLMYFMRTAIQIWAPSAGPDIESFRESFKCRFALFTLALIPLFLFIFASPVLELIRSGLVQFS